MAKKAKPSQEPQDERFQMRASKSFMQKIEDWRATQRPIPSLSDAIRILTDRALEAEAKKRGKK